MRSILTRSVLPMLATTLTWASLSTGCGPAAVADMSVPVNPRGVITAEQIEGMTARTAWDVLEQGHVPLGFRSWDGQGGRPSRRGPGLAGSTEPLVIVNGLRTEGSRALHDILATDVATIRVISGNQATQLYGTGARGGAILIELKGGAVGDGRARVP
jgi:outer membrane cobalamin receptor